MPPRTRTTRRTTKKETPPVTEALTAIRDDEDDTDQVVDEQPTENAATAKRREKVKPSAAVFLSGAGGNPFTVEDVPERLKARDYKRADGYDDAMDYLWQNYVDAGMPHWSLSGDLTKEDRPADGWWSERSGIYVSAIVPNVDDAEALVRRAANRLGCSYRFKSEAVLMDDETTAYKIWFTAAPVIKNTGKTAKAKADSETDNESED